jgi:hypothetical protein
MNTSPDLFSDPAPLGDLTQPTSWRNFVHPVTGKRVADVIESLCLRYSILRTLDAQGADLFIAWRRQHSPQGRWEPPLLVGGYTSGDAAREGCANHAEANP